MNNFDYRYMVYNTVKKEYQFARICEKTAKAATNMLFRLIGNNAKKWRFEIKKVKTSDAEKIVKAINLKKKIEKINKLLPNLSTLEVEELINEDTRRENKHDKNR